MAAVSIPPPGTINGPCKPTPGANGVMLNCAHIDCKASREEAATICPVCRTPIGYDRWFWSVENGTLEHQLCTFTTRR